MAAGSHKAHILPNESVRIFDEFILPQKSMNQANNTLSLRCSKGNYFTVTNVHYIAAVFCEVHPLPPHLGMRLH